MKNIVFLLFTFALTTLNAQKGSWYIGGVGGYKSSTSKSVTGQKTTTSNWVAGPEIGTFLTNKIQLGLVASVGGSNLKVDGTSINSSTNISPTLYGRYFFNITDNLSAFGGLYFNFTSSTGISYSPVIPDVKTDNIGFGGRLGIGIAYALSPRFTAVGQFGLFGYEMSNSRVDGADAGSYSAFDFGVNTVGSSSLVQGNGSGSVFNIGIYYTFLSK